MANSSIYAAFERMWQHTTNALENKSNTDHNHDGIYATEIYVDEAIASAGSGNALQKTGDTMEGILKFTENVHYGATLPETGEEGQIFFLEESLDGAFLPDGGTQGQVLIKNSDEDGDAVWGEIVALPEGGTANQILTKNSATDGDATWKTASWLPLSGGTVTGQITIKNTTATPEKGTILPALNVSYQNGAGTYYNSSIIDMIGTGNADNTYNLSVRFGSPSGTTIISSGESGQFMPAAAALADDEAIYLTSDGKIEFYTGCANDATAYTKTLTMTSSRVDSHVAFYGAVYNDYAEYRELKENIAIPYGRVVIENGDDTLSLSTKRLQGGGNICSDTFGFAIGETDKAKMPIAVSGRALAYPYEDRNSYAPGDAVCTGPKGTVSKMTREEIKEWPDRIIGYVSAVPAYETWGQNNVAVDGRIWIKVK